MLEAAICILTTSPVLNILVFVCPSMGRLGRDRMIVGLDLLLPMQSVPITIDVVSSNLDQGEVYNIKLVSDLRHVGCFLQVLRGFLYR